MAVTGRSTPNSSPPGSARAAFSMTLPCLTAVQEHACRDYPAEACGALAGDRQQQIAHTIVELPNAATTKRVRFRIPPRALLSLERRLDAAGLQLLAYYHSHPDSPATPSVSDLKAAVPGTTSLIVGVGPTGVTDVRSWKLRDDHAGWTERSIHTEIA